MSRTTIRVFEHERLAIGETRRDTDEREWHLRQSEFDALVRFNESYAEQVFEVGHKKIKFRNFVGYVQVGDLGLEILPKVDRNAGGTKERAYWHDALLEMLRIARQVRIRASTEAKLDLQRASLLDVFVARFLDEVERLLHEGLARSYRDIDDNCRTYKGRLLVRQNIRENLVHAERFFVTHTVFDHEHLPNQILRVALDILCQTSLRGGLRERAEALRSLFPEIRPIEIRKEHFARIVYGRRTERYREALELARMILLQRSPRLRGGKSELLALLFDMNVLWEEYIGAIAKRSAPDGARVRLQSSRLFWRAPGQRRSLRPDIVIERAGEPFLIVDTKWKIPRDGRPSDADLKQMFAYNELFGVKRSVLLYPTRATERNTVRGRFQSGTHTCETMFVALPRSTSGKLDSSELGARLRQRLFTVPASHSRP